MTDRYAVFGNPIKHSLSPSIHSEFARQCEQDIDYQKILVDMGGFDKAAKEFFASGGKGLNITVPFKEDAYRFADELSERASAAEAVNTLIALEDGTIRGDNTDGAGLLWDLQERLNWQLKEKNILILGAGGAVKGILLPLLNAKPKKITIANRTVSKAAALVDKFSANGTLISCGLDINGDENFDLVINGTAASLGGDLPFKTLTAVDKTTAFYDLVYAKEDTAFMSWARKSVGASSISDGIGMLVGQAAESFYLWRAVRPKPGELIELLSK